MNSLSNLTPQENSVHKNSKRVGRGQGSGKGGTATRGHNGAKSRSGYSKKLGFEGGQMPLQRRLPKFGFTNINRVEYQPINLSKIQELINDKKVDKEITIDTFISLGLAKKAERIKILGDGDLTSEVKITAHKFSKSAQQAIEKLGGETISLIKYKN